MEACDCVRDVLGTRKHLLGLQEKDLARKQAMRAELGRAVTAYLASISSEDNTDLIEQEPVKSWLEEMLTIDRSLPVLEAGILRLKREIETIESILRQCCS